MKNPSAVAFWLVLLGGALSCQSSPEKGSTAGAGSPATAAGASSSSAGTASGLGGNTQVTAGSSSGGMTSGAATGGASSSNAGSANAGTPASAGSGGQAELPPLVECTKKPSIDRLTEWVASGEGTTVPATGSILVNEGAAYVGKVEFQGDENNWHVIPVYIANTYGETVDLTTSSGITLTYSATAEFHVQLRSLSHWSGGEQYATTIPSTSGKKETHFFSFAAAGWKSLFGPPVLSYPDTLKEGMGLVFTGPGENEVVFYGLRIDGFTPPCE